MRKTSHRANPEHEATYQELVALVARHSTLSPAELLAIGANMLGKLIALQDQRVMTKEMALEIVALNMEAGNADMVAEVLKGKGGTA